jgi:hypothetical protein
MESEAQMSKADKNRRRALKRIRTIAYRKGRQEGYSLAWDQAREADKQNRYDMDMFVHARAREIYAMAAAIHDVLAEPNEWNLNRMRAALPKRCAGREATLRLYKGQLPKESI